MVYHAFSLFSLVWLLSYLCATVFSARLPALVSSDAVPTPPSYYFTPKHPISRRDPSSLSRRARIQSFLRKRELIITMLNGEPVESHFVNLLDLWHMAEKAIANTPEGTPRHAELVDFQETTATELTRLMQGVAILQSVVPPEPTSTSEPAQQTIQVEGTVSADVTISATATGTSSTELLSTSESSRAEPTSGPAPTPTSPTATTGTPQTTGTPEAPGASTTVSGADPVPTIAQGSGPAPQPSSPTPDGGAAGQNGNAGGNARDPTQNTPPTVSGTVTRSSGLNAAEAAQTTGDVDLAGSANSLARLPSVSWLVLGALVVAGIV